MGTRSAPSRRQDGRWRPSRSSFLIALVVLVLATVPVLVPLLVTGARPAAAPPPRPAEITAPDLSRPAPRLPEDRAARDASRSPVQPAPSAGTLAPTTATPTPTPAAAGTPAASTPGASRPAPTPSATPSRPTTLIAAPDLVVLGVSWSPGEPKGGDQVTFTATVRNDGSEPTQAGTALAVAFSVDGTKVTWSTGDPAQLLPGETRTLTAAAGVTGPAWTATAGPHQILAYADPDALVTESDEGNNAITASITVA